MTEETADEKTAGQGAAGQEAGQGAAGREAANPTTTVHLLRHGEVDNPGGILYGRLPGYHLSELGRKMADQVAESLAGRDVVGVISSPLERATETAQPVAAVFDLELRTDPRLIEAENAFQGLTFGVGDGSLRRPSYWRLLLNPFRPSWGEPYVRQAARMLAAVTDIRNQVRGHEVVCVSHQLPIWIIRCFLEGRRLWHDPRRRQCSLASLTSLTYVGDELDSITYSEPARDLLPLKPGVPGA